MMNCSSCPAYGVCSIDVKNGNDECQKVEAKLKAEIFTSPSIVKKGASISISNDHWGKMFDALRIQQVEEDTKKLWGLK